MADELELAADFQAERLAVGDAATTTGRTALTGEEVTSSMAPEGGTGPAEVFQLKSPPTLAPPAVETKKRKKSEPDEASQSPFSVAIREVYDGPFDLLLDLIRKQNLDIYDIPIARITAQFLEYTRHLQATDIDAAGEFVYTASLLIHIKSRTLLPREPGTGGGLLDVEDPRRELVERLLEHERFKAAAQMLQQKQQVEDATWTKSGMKGFLNDEGVVDSAGEREIAADTGDLIRIFREIMDRLRERPVHRVDEDTVTVAQMLVFMKRRLSMEDKPVSLRRLLRSVQSERALICTFLAMLELVRLQAILLRQPENFGDILLKKTDQFDEVLADEAHIRDDWD